METTLTRQRRYRGAVFFDMDGTLVDSRAGIFTPTEQTCQAIRKLREAGYLTGLATGRAKCYLSPDSFLFDCYVTSNGSHAEADGITIANHVIPPEALRRVVDYLDRQKINFVAEGQESCWCRDIQETYFRRMIERFHWDDSCFYQIKNEIPIAVNKLMVCYDSMEKLWKFQKDFGNEYDITEQPVNQSSDVGRKGISKGLGVREVMEYFSLSKENTYAFGDADNDIDMLRTVGNGIAMGNHTDALGTAACYITGTVTEEGIASALSHFHLI